MQFILCACKCVAMLLLNTSMCKVLITYGKSHLVHVLHSGRQVVPDSAHGLQRRLIEVGRLTVYHLDHHDTQGPDIHL